MEHDLDRRRAGLAGRRRGVQRTDARGGPYLGAVPEQAAALYHVGKGVGLEPSMRVLYLGAANGTTVSHVADYTDAVYAVSFAPRPMQDLIEVARRRRMFPHHG